MSLLPPDAPRWLLPLLVASALAGVVGYGLIHVLAESPPPRAPQLAVPPPKPKYPSDPIVTVQPERRVLFSTPVGSGNVFRGLDSVTATALPTSQALAQEQARDSLRKAGYSWGPEGFINAARKGDMNALITYLKLGMDPNSQNAFGSSAAYAATEANQPEALKLLAAADRKSVV